MSRSSRLPVVPLNPFCTQCVRPGAIPFRFPGVLSADGLVDRLRDTKWRGAIIGPHGSGKSTLLIELLHALERCGRRPTLLTLHDGDCREVAHFRARRVTPGSVIAVDGYEQLNVIRRSWLRWQCWRRGLGLVVTAHEPVGLPVLFHTEVTLALAQDIASQLQDGCEKLVAADDVACQFARCGGNVRELLFALFDLYEARRRTGK